MIQRYRILANGKVIPSDSGGYCAYADCASLTQQVAALRKALEDMVAADMFVEHTSDEKEDKCPACIAYRAAQAALQLTSDGENG
jgi:hypothetical protein